MKCPLCGWENLPGVDECASCLGSLMQEDVPQPETPEAHSIMTDPVTVLSHPVLASISAEASVALSICPSRSCA